MSALRVFDPRNDHAQKQHFNMSTRKNRVMIVYFIPHSLIAFYIFLALILRRSREIYQFEIPNTTTTLVESEHEVYAFEGTRDPNSKELYVGKAIALGITGVLVKYMD